MCCKGGWKQYMPGPGSRAGGLTLTSDPCWEKKQMTELSLIFLPSSGLCLKPSQKQPLLCLPQNLFLEDREQRRRGFSEGTQQISGGAGAGTSSALCR